MADLSVQNKVIRIVHFYAGLRHDAVRRLLEPFGFDKGAMEEGRSLVTEAGALCLENTTVHVAGPETLEQLIAFESTWFPIVRQTLARANAALSDELFANLSQQGDRNALLSVGIFLERLADLTRTDGAFEAAGPAARALLSARGFTAAVEAQGQALIAALDEAKATPVPEVEAVVRDAAVDKAWLWYREWSAIARVAVKSKRLLRVLGFRQGHEEDDDSVAPQAPTPPAVPSLPAAPTSGGVPTAA